MSQIISESILKNFVESFQRGFKKTNIDLPSYSQIIQKEKIISESWNQVEHLANPTKHSELLAIELALQITKSKYLNDCILLTTLEPCIQCGGSIIKVKLGTVAYFVEAKTGEGFTSIGMDSIYSQNHFPKIQYIKNPEFQQKFQEFFLDKR